MTIEVDKRSIKARRDPEADARLAKNITALRDLQIVVARDLAQVDASAHFVFSGCASVVEYAVKLGFGALRIGESNHLSRVLRLA